MSWWVNDYIAVSEDETQQLCNIQADAVSDLPAQDQTATAGFIFVRGSKAYVLDTSGQYIMNSSGQWILQKSGQEIEIGADDIIYNNTDSGMTATNVQDAIDEIKDLDDMQDRALSELYAENTNQQLEINYSINTGSKNKLNLSLTTQTVNGVTFTVNDDQTITVNGTPTTSFATTIVTVTGLLGDYTLTGCPSGGSGSTYRLYRAGASASESDVGSGYTYTFEPQNSHAIRIYLYTGNTFNNLTFKPMLRAAEIKSNTFEPYAPTNRELYETKTEQIETNVIANLGAKNMLYISNDPGYTATSHGRTFTVLSDGGIKITGASSDSSNADFYIIGSWSNRNILLNENKDSCLMRMKCDTDYGYNQIRLRAMNRSTGSTVNETGVETNKDVQLSHVITTVFISVFPSVTLPEDGIVVYPMIRRAEITDSTYVPYAPTNRELYEMILALQSGRSTQSVNSLSKLDLNRNDLNESLDSNFDLIDSIPEEEEGEEDV